MSKCLGYEKGWCIINYCIYIYKNKYKFYLLKLLLVINVDDFLNICNKGDFKFKDFNLYLFGEGGRGIIYGI